MPETSALGGEVEAAKVPHEQELRQFEAHVDAALVLAGDLALTKKRQSIADRVETAGNQETDTIAS